MAAIKTVRQRDNLKPRREPYWYPLATGRHLGYRRTDTGGTWIARLYDPATRRRAFKALPESGALPASMQFDDAAKRAREWFRHVEQEGNSATITVRQACERYLSKLSRDRRIATADDVRARFERNVYNTHLAKIELQKLKKMHVHDWRHGYESTPTRPPRRGNKYINQPPPNSRPQSAATINRGMTPLRAALNLAKRDGFVTTDAAWLVPLTPKSGATVRREVYLDREQRRNLLAALPTDLATFVRALCLIPMRPGALAGLTVSDFNSRAGTVHVRIDKVQAGRSIPISEAATTLFKEQARGKLPATPLLARDTGAPWSKDAWKKSIKSAAIRTGLPRETTLYAIRHSTITDLVIAGLDLFTVAKLAGTSIAMIEKHYGHLQADHARKAMEALAL